MKYGKKRGSPPTPTTDQIATLEKAGKLEMLNPPTQIKIDKGIAPITINLPRQEVSLLIFSNK